MKRVFVALIVGIISLFALPPLSQTHAAMTFGSGYYTNLCGSQGAADTDSCNQGCDPSSGTCTVADKNNVIKYVCDGNLAACRVNGSGFAPTQSVNGATCGQTVEIDVYKKTCNTIFGWFCNDSDRLDYMVWYAGDCAGQPATTPPSGYQTARPRTPIAQPAGSCDNLSVTGGNNGNVPANVSFKMAGTDSTGAISGYRYYFGDGIQVESANAQVTHQYQASGTFTARGYAKDSRGNWTTSPSCETAVTVGGFPFETQKSACSNVFILSGNYTKAPTTATFEIAGYDNKGPIKEYKMDYGNGVTATNTTNTFTYTYPTAGTFLARGYILNSQNVWQTTSGLCEQAVYATTTTLTSQPDTGTPTWFTLLALTSGVVGAGMILSWKLQTEPSKKRRRSRG